MRPVALAGLLAAGLAGSTAAQPVGVRPGAGRLIGAPVTPLTPYATNAIAHDRARGWIWVTTPIASSQFPGAYLYPVDPTTLTRVTTFPPPILDDLDGGGPPGPDINGPTNGVAVLADGRLLLTDNGGDQLRFDDMLFEVDPDLGGPTARLTSFWYLDDRCTGSCRANTNTDVPVARIDDVRDVDASDGNAAGPGPVLIAGRDTEAGLAEVALVPGTPGTWRVVRRHVPPTGGSVTAVDFDPDQAAAEGLANVYWMTGEYTAGLVYETTLEGGRFLLHQAFYAPIIYSTFRRPADGLTAVRGTRNPHVLVGWSVDLGPSSPMAARFESGTGPLQAFPMEGDLIHSLAEDDPRLPWDLDAASEELQVWHEGSPVAVQLTTREEWQVLLNVPLPRTENWNIDAIALDPAFSSPARDPSIFDFVFSFEGHMEFGPQGVLASDLVKIRPDGTFERRVWGWEVALELGLEWPPDIDALAILPGRGYAISLSASVASTNPHLAPAIDGRDVLLIPEVFAFDSGRRLWRGDELETITNVLGYQLGNCGSIEIDPRGNPARPNPNLPGTTRPDLLFTRDVDTPFSHVFSTRSAGSKDGVLVRHRATYGYGTAKAVPDALAVLPGVSPPPTMDARATLRGPAPSFRNEITLIARTLGPRSTGWWILGLDRLVPGLDLHPDVTHNPLMVAPIVALPLVADEHGTARFELSVPQLGTPAVFYLQAFSDDRRALSPPAILTLQ